jgi:hypothetical protein
MERSLRISICVPENDIVTTDQMKIRFTVSPTFSVLSSSSLLHQLLNSLTQYLRPENTYNKLFAAARPPPALTRSTSSQDHTPRQPPQRQHLLHRFWSISSPPTVSDPIDVAPSSAPTCEDCEAPLDLRDNDISMGGMDDEDSRGSEFACRYCGRRVCGICAIVEIGVGRECLQCRTSRRKKWVGGIGWMT